MDYISQYCTVLTGLDWILYIRIVYGIKYSFRNFVLPDCVLYRYIGKSLANFWQFEVSMKSSVLEEYQSFSH